MGLQRKCAVLFLSTLCIAAQAQGTAGKTLTVSGSENGSGSSWDTGSIGITINGYAKTFSYAVGDSAVPASVASYIAAHISEDTSEPVWAKATGSVITMVSRIPGTPISITSAAETPSSGFSASFTLTSASTTALPSLVLHCTPNSIGPGQVTDCTASITGTDALEGAPAPSNSVVFTVNSSSWTSVAVSPDGDAVASDGLSGASAGIYTIAASYTADSNYPAMSATTHVTVNFSDPTTTGVYSYLIKQSDGTTSGYDGAGNITAYYDSTSGQWNNIQYDALNRLVRADGPSAFNSGNRYFCWTYDSFGNRTAQNFGTSNFTVSSGSCSGGGTTTTDTQSYNTSNQLTGATHPTGSFSYDAAGNVTEDSNHGYAYDAEGRLCAMSTTIESITTYTGYLYNAEGIRVAEGSQSSLSCDLTSNGFSMTNMYILGQDGQTLTETDGSGNWLHTDVPAGPGAMATYDPSGLHFRFTDWLGTHRVQTNYAGSVETSFQGLPFGEILGSSSGTTEKHFTGKEHDDESGNDYFDARYYSSSMGRFMVPDWASHAEAVPYANFDDPQSLNLYLYVHNNPFSRIDPDGHIDWELLKKGISDAAKSVTIKIAGGLGLEYGIERKGVGAKGGIAAKGEWSISKKGASFQLKGEVGVEGHTKKSEMKLMPSATVKLLEDGKRVDSPHIEFDKGVEFSRSNVSLDSNNEVGFGLTASETGVVGELGVKANTSELKNGLHELYEGLTTNPSPKDSSNPQ